MSAPGIRFTASDVEFHINLTRLSYQVDSTSDGKREIDVWLPTNERDGVHITSLEVGSGGGKSTFARELVLFLAGEQSGQGLSFSFSNAGGRNTESRSVALIPQKPAQVMHWKISDILPRSSSLMPKFFNPPLDFGRHISSLSGGQAARIYTCSALEALSQSSALLNYLVLDEAFEGVNAAHANELLHAIVDYWRERTGRHLFVMLISHLEPAQVFRKLSPRRLSLNPQEPRDLTGGAITTEIPIRIAFEQQGVSGA